jgi:hypothetical protein
LRLFNDYLTDKHFEDIDKHLPQLELITINGLNDNTINCLAKMSLLSIEETLKSDIVSISGPKMSSILILIMI